MEVEYEQSYFEAGKDGKGYELYGNFEAHLIRATHIVEMFNPTSVLDCGCAYGYIVRYLLDKGISAFGIDISRWCEEKAKTIIPHNFMRHDIRKPLPFPDMSFDLLYCEGVLEHIEEKYIDDIMKEFGRVAKRRLFQIALEEHKDVGKEVGHQCIKPHSWWANKMPMRTFLALHASSDTNMFWIYKG